jgi:hypothetical protein
MWNESAAIIKSELNSSEQLLWAGQPRSGIVFRLSDAYMIPFSLLWTGGVCYTIVQQPTFSLFSAVGLSVGFYFLAGRFFVEAWKRKRIFYGITTERVILISNFFSRNVSSVNMSTLSDLTLTQRADGSGDIVLGGAVRSSGWFKGSDDRRRQDEQPALELIADARHVYDILRDAHTKAQYGRQLSQTSQGL